MLSRNNTISNIVIFILWIVVIFELHIVDITCTHLGCELKWNSAEKSWDCPCHGLRFTFEGDII